MTSKQVHIRNGFARTAFGWIGVAMIALSGCSQFDMKKNIPWGAGENAEFAPPLKVAAIWTDTVLNQANASSLRGFGGRLMFYAAEGGKPIKVQGALVVYAFDETGRDTEHVKPDRKFVFTAEQFEKHYSKSPLGHSYSVWLPWDEAGGPRREISLLVRFTPLNGAVVVGDASKQNLPGYSESDVTQYPAPAAAPATVPPYLYPTPPTVAAPMNGSPLLNAPAVAQVDPAVQPVAYQAPLPGAAAPNFAAPTVGAPALIPTDAQSPRRMTTTTINIPAGTRMRNTTFAPNVYGTGAGGYQAAQAANGQNLAPYANGSAATSLPGSAAAMNSAMMNSATMNSQAGPGSPGAAASGAPEPQRSGHYGPQRLRPLGAPLDRLVRDHAPWQPLR